MHLLFLIILFAQAPDGDPNARTIQAARWDEIFREQLINAARTGSNKAAEQAAQRQAMNNAEKQFVERFNTLLDSSNNSPTITTSAMR
jgi:hypothetical protein